MSETVKVLLVEDDPVLNRNIRDALVQEGIALMGSMGLLPAALSTGMGSEIQKPLAIMIVGGC